MMSHYGLPYEFDDRWLCGSLELSIETLTGTAFEIKVSPNDTIMSIKSKIQSVEGIPVSQQHLLYNLKELDNSASVQDYSIKNGATLKLVLSMRVGPISTKRLPPVDEMAWRELQELISETHKNDLYEALPSGSKLTVLIFHDGEQVNLLKVVENEDGSFSPLSESWNQTSIRNFFVEEDPEEIDKRLKENFVTMGKVEELKERLETLSIQRKEKKSENSFYLRELSKSQVAADDDDDDDDNNNNDCRKKNLKKFNGASYSSSELDDVTRSLDVLCKSKPVLDSEHAFIPLRHLLSCSKISMDSLNKAKKEAEKIIEMQSKLSVLVDSERNRGFEFKRPPLPEIRRASSSDKEEKKMSQDEKLRNTLREKTTRSFAIVEEENDLAPTPSICSSQSSVMALPSSEEVAAAITFSPFSGERVPTTISRSRYKVSRYVLENAERPKTTPAKVDGRRNAKSEQYCNLIAEKEPPSTSKRTSHVLSTISTILPRTKFESETNKEERAIKNAEYSKRLTSKIIRKPSIRDELLEPMTAHKLTSPLVKKRMRCLQCKKKLNITNTYNCRCGGLFCAVHRYSEVHNCLFDYKKEGRRMLQQMNPLIAASKLPKI